MPAIPDGAPLRPSHPAERPLAELLVRLPDLRAAGNLPPVSGCTHDSRAVRPGDLYAALPGATVHGADFADQAVRAGAVAVLTDPSGESRASAAGVPVLVADDPRAVLGTTASWVHGDPSRRLQVLAVTGTNGKTTTAFLLEAGLRAAGRSTGLLGTVVTRVGEVEVPSQRTTPEAPDLHALFAVMVERGTQAVAMEVSSHALALGRVDGVLFDGAVFLNLSQDHLDFHTSLEDYFQAKASLFTPARTRRALVDVDDEHGRRLAATALVPTTTYGTDGLWRAVDVTLEQGGSTFTLLGPGTRVAASVQLPGGFNVANAVAALGALVEAGIPVEDAVRGVAGLTGVPGRMERVDEGQPFSALVDYAHTPEAVRTLLATVRRLTGGKVLVVLGCGGDRDRGKRPLMGRAAVEGADVAILTSDNPRSEDPAAILAEMAQPGAQVEPDRRAAIELAVRLARPGDVLVVAGKGHESGQEIDGTVHPFDDRLVLRAALRAAPVGPA